MKTALASGMVLATALMLSPEHALASADETFALKCAGCHANGGNVLAAGKTLKLDDLTKNDVATIEALYEVIYYGKNKMPGFGVNCAPAGKCTFAARLPDEDLKDMSSFVLDKAQEDWK